MPEIVGQRVDQLRRKRGLTQQGLADLVGVSQPTIGRIISGETKETFKMPELVAALRTNAAFLYGQSDEDGEAEGLSDRLMPFRGALPEPDPDLVEIDEIDLRFGLGGTYFDSPVEVSKRQFSRSWLRNFTNALPESLVSTIGDGDSMEPTIRSGEVVLIDRSQKTPMMGDGIWAIAFGEVGMIKRLRPMPDGSVEIHSDNPLVRPLVATDGELYIVGRVVAVVRRL